MLIIPDLYLIYKLKKNYDIHIDKCAYVVDIDNLEDMNIIKKFDKLQKHYFKLKELIPTLEKSKQKAYRIRFYKIKNKLIEINLVIQNLLKYTRENIKSISFYFNEINIDNVCNLIKFISEKNDSQIFENYFLNYKTINILTPSIVEDSIPDKINSFVDKLFENSTIESNKKYLDSLEINFYTQSQ